MRRGGCAVAWVGVVALLLVNSVVVATVEKEKGKSLEGTGPSDTSPKCLACTHIVTSLRDRYFHGDNSARDLHVADPCHTIAKGLRLWCEDVFRKLSTCPSFAAKAFDQSYNPDRICEECDYDLYPLPPVKYCVNPLYQVSVADADQCTVCMRIVQATRDGIDACQGLPTTRCGALQTKLQTCSAFQTAIRQARADARDVCEECEAIADNRVGDYHDGRTMCERPNPTPLRDCSSCSVCINIVHNTRYFPSMSACQGMDACECAQVQDKLAKCSTFAKMLNYRDFSAKSICQECRDDKNPLSPVRFCDFDWEPLATQGVATDGRISDTPLTETP